MGLSVPPVGLSVPAVGPAVPPGDPGPAASPQSFGELPHRPLLVELTVEEGQRLKVIYGSGAGFHAIDVDSGNTYDLYVPVHVSGDTGVAPEGTSGGDVGGGTRRRTWDTVATSAYV